MNHIAHPLGSLPELAWLPIDRLTVDSRYQRETGSRRSRNIIDHIAKAFRWARFGAVLAVKVGNDWMVIDGQHRVEACRQRGDIAHVPAVVLPHATVAEAAADFVAVNRDRVAVTSLHIHHAMLAAGDPQAITLDRVCKAAGISICRYPVPADKMKPGETIAVGSVQQLIRTTGEDRAAIVLKVLSTAFAGRPGEVRSDLMKAVATLILDGDAEPAKLTDVLRNANTADLRQAANHRGEKGTLAKLTAEIGARAKGGGGKRRNCLRCGTSFMSAGAGNRMCTRCGGASSFADGV